MLPPEFEPEVPASEPRRHRDKTSFFCITVSYPFSDDIGMCDKVQTVDDVSQSVSHYQKLPSLPAQEQNYLLFLP
jgi:hypothetical protein